MAAAHDYPNTGTPGGISTAAANAAVAAAARAKKAIEEQKEAEKKLNEEVKERIKLLNEINKNTDEQMIKFVRNSADMKKHKVRADLPADDAGSNAEMGLLQK